MRLIILLLAVSLGCVGCSFDSPAGPVIPPINPPPVPPVIPIPGRSAASSLVISRLSFGAQYSPTVLILTESSGKNAATVDAIDLATPNENSERDCLGIGSSVRILAGQSRDLAKDLGYCMPYFIRVAGLPSVTLKIGFHDDDGGTGELIRTVELASCTATSGVFVCDGLDK